MTELESIISRLYPGYIIPQSILSPDQEVEYNDAQHKYYINENGKIINYISATTIVSQFIEEFDTKQKAEWMVYRYGQSVEYWIEKWRRDNTISLDRGNRLHSEQERFLYQCGCTTISNDKRHMGCVPEHWVHNVQKEKHRYTSISKLADGCYPELKLWRHDVRIAGRPDKPIIETYNGVRYAHIEDYKTNKEVAKNGFIDKHGNERMMKYPIQHLPDCEYSHYCLQLSIYQYMFEYFGYEPGFRRLIHFPHPIEDLGTPNPVIYELPYLRDEVIAMIYFLNQH